MIVSGAEDCVGGLVIKCRRRNQDQVSGSDRLTTLSQSFSRTIMSELQNYHIKLGAARRELVKWLGDIFLAIVICGEEINDVISISV